MKTQQIATALRKTLDLSDKEIVEITQSIISGEEVSAEFESMECFDDFLNLISPFDVPHHIIDMHHSRVLVVFNF